jgi:ParB-like chromosome segregation protein Spo0J
MTNQNPCSIDGCGKAATAKGLCSRHYMRQRRHGSPDVTLPPGPKKARPLAVIHHDPGDTMTELAKTTSWRDLIKVHPAADLFPLMSPEELRELGEDIKANGLKVPIETWFDKDGDEEWLIDGRNRLDAMTTLGYRFVRKETQHGEWTCPEHLIIYEPTGRKTVQVRPHHGDPYAVAVSFNINRRHLTAEQKRDLIEVLLKAKPERSDRATAKLAKVSDKTVGAVREKLEATAEIPQLGARVGADGKARKQSKHEEPKPAEEKLAPLPEPLASMVEEYNKSDKDKLAEIGAAYLAENTDCSGLLAGKALEDPPVVQRLHALMHIVDDLTKLANGDKSRLAAVAKLDRARSALEIAFMGGS